MTMRRPDRLRVESTRRDGRRRVFLFDERRLAVSDPDLKVYATEPRPGTVDAALDYLTENLRMRMPLHELFSADLPKKLASIGKPRWVDADTIAGTATDHVLLRGDGTDLQVWIAKEGDALPRRIVITYRQEEGQPQFRASFTEWNLSPDVPDALFVFTPPEGAEKIQFAAPGAATQGPPPDSPPAEGRTMKTRQGLALVAAVLIAVLAVDAQAGRGGVGAAVAAVAVAAAAAFPRGGGGGSGGGRGGGGFPAAARGGGSFGGAGGAPGRRRYRAGGPARRISVGDQPPAATRAGWVPGGQGGAQLQQRAAAPARNSGGQRQPDAAAAQQRQDQRARTPAAPGPAGSEHRQRQDNGLRTPGTSDQRTQNPGNARTNGLKTPGVRTRDRPRGLAKYGRTSNRTGRSSPTITTMTTAVL